MTKNVFLLLSVCFSFKMYGQIINQAPYILTIDELKNWTTTGPTASNTLIATQPLLNRFVNVDTQFNSVLNNNLEVAYLPDGMNNFANYGHEQNQFNLYNFTNWAYIDKLIWFGGTSTQTVQLPSAPWVNTAHKNGVKVFGNVFFAPNVFGGATNTLLSFLEQDASGSFIVIPKMIAMMEYYNFDGWFVNQETNTNTSTALLIRNFLEDLTTAVESLDKEVMWYDAMLINGNVSWQNQLNAQNSMFVQDDEDNSSANGFEKKVSSNIFINFFWSFSSFPSQSRTRANAIGRSEFEVFTGVDLWPGRNQSNFEFGGNSWMSWLHESPVTPYTSLGLFAPNCVYNNSNYSNFNNDPNDYAKFYNSERHLFSGLDYNPSVEDVTGFKGISNWVPASSTINNIPFETNFNTGHGLKKFSKGVEITNAPWHNMNAQDILPTWQFSFSDYSKLSGSWDFDLAYNGGSSLLVEGSLNNANTVDLLLYKTKLLMTNESKIDVIYNYEITEGTILEIILVFEDAPNNKVTFNISPNGARGWIENTVLLNAFTGRELASIGMRYASSFPISNYKMNIGTIKVHEGSSLSTTDAISLRDDILVMYPKNIDNVVRVSSKSGNTPGLELSIYNIHGASLHNYTMKGRDTLDLKTDSFSSGIYLLLVQDALGRKTSKRIIID